MTVLSSSTLMTLHQWIFLNLDANIYATHQQCSDIDNGEIMCLEFA